MDDPYSLAWRISGLAIWHKDPRDPNHSDPGHHGDTAGWACPRLNQTEMDYAAHLSGKDNDIDNLAHWFPGLDQREIAGRIRQIFRLHKRIARPWWKHQRWHFWNYRINPK